MVSAPIPPLSSSGVFSVAHSILINAPREKVWDVLLDFKSYKEWNPFGRGQTIVSATGVTLADQTPAAGDLMLISPINIPPTMGEPRFMGSLSITVLVMSIDHENYRAAWVSSSRLPKWVLFVERWQSLTIERGQTKYESIEVFHGILAYICSFFLGKNLNLGIKAMAEGLRSRCEGAGV
ncbi:hypothetical protein B0H16DRAFT_1417236 [Mycena metata]|uniref:Polyketide cyclase/dehydrase n=1 Tax=Mycena metata TaxID=1033252 RepID=A0AAD7J4K0_9AGAR|nr:hypothetical protein B0H16DRAFT_1417236 [Mycena metata]